MQVKGERKRTNRTRFWEDAGKRGTQVYELNPIRGKGRLKGNTSERIVPDSGKMQVKGERKHSTRTRFPEKAGERER